MNPLRSALRSVVCIGSLIVTAFGCLGINCTVVVAFLLAYAAPTFELSAKPTVTETDLFISGQDNINIYRIPSLLVACSGTILAISEARAGDDGDATDLVLKRSVYIPPQAPRTLNGYSRTFGYAITWEPMRVIVAGNGDAVMQPCAVLDKSTGRIWLHCYRVRGGLAEHIKDPHVGRVLVTSSDDEGQTWSSPRDLTDSIPRFIAGPGVGIQLKSGRLVIPGYWSPGKRKLARSCAVYSDDHGQSWRRGEPVKGQTDEAQAVELSNGEVLLNSRSNRGKQCRYVAWSRDGGQSWYSEHDEPQLPETGDVCQASIVRDDASTPDKDPRLLFVNAAQNRTHLTVRLSSDDGKTWSTGRTLQSGPAAYSSTALLKDGTIAVLYETGRSHPYEKITLARFTPAWLAAKASAESTD